MTILFWPSGRLTLLWVIFPFLALMNAGHSLKVPLFSVNSCAVHIAKHEKQLGIPHGLLHAISKVESGRKDDTGRIVAWPWAVNARGQSYYFPTKNAAIIAVRRMQLSGIKSIDIGCMQVNLYHHPHAFKSLGEAFDPAKNVAYAARFLTGLKKEHASWHTAIAHYHSANPLYHIPYRKSVLGTWNRDIKAGRISLAAGVFKSINSSKHASNNRIRRLTKVKTLSLRNRTLTPASHKGIVRRIPQGNASHNQKLRPSKPYKSSPRTLRVSS